LKAARNAIIGAALIAVSAWLAHLHVVAQTYHPVVRLASPDGLVYTAVQDATHERQACGVANDRFLGPVKQACKGCEVMIARCERELGGFELDVYRGKAIAHHTVQGPGVRMAIEGPQPAARASCEQIANQLAKSGLRSSGCVHPS
jgi:hypothetical protein